MAVFLRIAIFYKVSALTRIAKLTRLQDNRGIEGYVEAKLLFGRDITVALISYVMST